MLLLKHDQHQKATGAYGENLHWSVRRALYARALELVEPVMRDILQLLADCARYSDRTADDNDVIGRKV